METRGTVQYGRARYGGDNDGRRGLGCWPFPRLHRRVIQLRRQRETGSEELQFKLNVLMREGEGLSEEKRQSLERNEAAVINNFLSGAPRAFILKLTVNVCLLADI